MLAYGVVGVSDLRTRFEREALPHLDAVYNFAFRLTRREADARDLVQDAALRAFQHFDSFTTGTNCRAWLFTITYSVFVNRYRRQQRESTVVTPEDPGWPLDDRAVDPRSPSLTTPARATAAADVESALAELPDDFRAAIVLVDVEGLSYDDAAAVLDCPVGTVRSRLFRARKHLAERLRGYDTSQRKR